MVDEAISKLIQDTDEKCNISSLGHRDRFAKYRNLYAWLGLPAAVLAGIAAAVQTTSLSVDDVTIGNWVAGAAVVITWIVAALNASITFINPYAQSEAHRGKASKYAVLRSKMSRVQAIKKGDELSQEIESIVMEFEELQKAEPMLSADRIKYAQEFVESQKSNQGRY